MNKPNPQDFSSARVTTPDFWTFVTTEHSPRVMRRQGPLGIEISMLCACGTQTRWRKATHRLVVQREWVDHVHQERAHSAA